MNLFKIYMFFTLWFFWAFFIGVKGSSIVATANRIEIFTDHTPQGSYMVCVRLTLENSEARHPRFTQKMPVLYDQYNLDLT